MVDGEERPRTDRIHPRTLYLQSKYSGRPFAFSSVLVAIFSHQNILFHGSFGLAVEMTEEVKGWVLIVGLHRARLIL